VRQENRDAIAALYDLRNKATHGGTLKPRSASKTVDGIVAASTRLYVELTKTLLALPSKPDWKAIELEPTPPAANDVPSQTH
jgi:hypothetical protein